jgi:hypothetical protein
MDGHTYGVDFDAPSWAEAERVCEENGWSLRGELKFIVPWSESFGKEQADEMIAALNEREGATSQ